MNKETIKAENAENGFLDIKGVNSSNPHQNPESDGKDGCYAADSRQAGAPSSAEKSQSAISLETEYGEKNTGFSKTDIKAQGESKAEKENCEKTSSQNTDLAEITSVVAKSFTDEAKRAASVCADSEISNNDREFEALIRGKYRDAYKRRMEAVIKKRLRHTKPGQKNISEPQKDTEVAESSRPDAVRESSVQKIIPDINMQKSINKNRPRENGVGGSIGMVTGINVSALKGSEVIELLRRAENGEKIKFK